MEALQTTGIITLGCVTIMSLLYGEIVLLKRGWETSLFLYLSNKDTNVSKLTQTCIDSIELGKSIWSENHAFVINILNCGRWDAWSTIS